MWTSLTLIFVVFALTISGSEVCDYWKSVELTNGTYNGVHYQESEYFIDNNTGIQRGCVCLKGICARKCCPHGQAYNSDKKLCVDVPVEFNPPVWDENILMEGFNVTKEFNLMFGKMNCSRDKEEVRTTAFPAAKEMRWRTDGKLYVEIPASIPPVFIYEPDKYCIDTFMWDSLPSQLDALICFVPTPENSHYGLSSICMLISCFFILLTVAVYAWLPELRNLHGMVLMAYLLCFFVGFLFLATMQILVGMKSIVRNTCTVFTFIVYFSLLSAFFWLNVMCYDIWWTFSGKRAPSQMGSPFKRFIYYAAYAFGVPTLLTIIMGALEFSNLPIQHPLMPKLRLQGCFLYGTSKLLYLYGPIVILVVANMTFFTLTAFKIAKVKRETEMLRDKNNSATHDQHKRDAQRFTLYLKLFTIMGISWILEVISSFYPEGEFYWQFTDAYNVLVGLIIFVIFVCKKKTFEMIQKRYRQIRNLPISGTQTTSTSNQTLSSQARSGIQMNSTYNINNAHK